MPDFPPQFRRRLATALAWLTVLGCLGGHPQEAAAQAVWELTPYRFHVFLAVEPCPEIPPPAIDRMAGDLVGRIDVAVGAAWNMTASDAEGSLARSMLIDLAAVGVDEIPPEKLENDKVTLVSVTSDVIGFRVRAREFDVQTQNFSAMVEESVPQAALISETIFSAVLDAFAPLAAIRSSETDEVELRLRAGRLPMRDPELVSIEPGTIFRPIIRYDNRDGTPKRILALPWSFLAVEAVEESTLTCHLYSGLRSPFAGRRRGRVHQLALAVKPPKRPTRLTIHARAGEKQPLRGYEIFLQEPGQTATDWLGRTDREGSILVPPAPTVLQIAYIRNGGQLLAKLPLVPGLEENLTAAVIDDGPRLAAESIIMAAQEELVDLVTKRAVLSARISAAIEAGKPEQADELLVQLYDLRTRDQFTQYLAQERQKLYSDDPLIKRRVDRMFDETRKLIVQYLDPEDISTISEKVNQAKRAARSENSG